MDISIQDIYVVFLIIMLIVIYFFNKLNPPESFEVNIELKNNDELIQDYQTNSQTQIDALLLSDEIEEFSIMNPHL